MVQWRRVDLLLVRPKFWLWVQDFHLVPDWPFASAVRSEVLHSRSSSLWSNYLPLHSLQIQGEVLVFVVLQLEGGSMDFHQHWTGHDHGVFVECVADATEGSWGCSQKYAWQVQQEEDTLTSISRCSCNTSLMITIWTLTPEQLRTFIPLGDNTVTYHIFDHLEWDCKICKYISHSRRMKNHRDCISWIHDSCKLNEVRDRACSKGAWQYRGVTWRTCQRHCWTQVDTRWT